MTSIWVNIISTVAVLAICSLIIFFIIWRRFMKKIKKDIPDKFNRRLTNEDNKKEKGFWGRRSDRRKEKRRKKREQRGEPEEDGNGDSDVSESRNSEPLSYSDDERTERHLEKDWRSHKPELPSFN